MKTIYYAFIKQLKLEHKLSSPIPKE